MKEWTGTVNRRSSEGGFTLIEVTVGLTICAVMAVIVLEATRVGSRAWDKVERRAEADQRSRVTHDLLTHELSRVEPVLIKIEGRRVAGFRGGPDRLMFYGAPDVAALEPYSGMMRRVSFGVEPERGLVLREGWPLVDGQVGLEVSGGGRVLDPRVTAIRFRYLAPPTKEVGHSHWITDWDPLERMMSSLKVPVGSKTSVGGLLPLAIEITITFTEGPELRMQQFLFPVRVGRSLLS